MNTALDRLCSVGGSEERSVVEARTVMKNPSLHFGFLRHRDHQFLLFFVWLKSSVLAFFYASFSDPRQHTSTPASTLDLFLAHSTSPSTPRSSLALQEQRFKPRGRLLSLAIRNSAVPSTHIAVPAPTSRYHRTNSDEVCDPPRRAMPSHVGAGDADILGIQAFGRRHWNCVARETRRLYL